MTEYFILDSEITHICKKSLVHTDFTHSVYVSSPTKHRPICLSV